MRDLGKEVLEGGGRGYAKGGKERFERRDVWWGLDGE